MERQMASLQQLQADSADVQALMEEAKGTAGKEILADVREATTEISCIWQSPLERPIGQLPPIVGTATILVGFAHARRAAANANLVAERQQVEKLNRDRKTQLNAVKSTEDKIQQAEARKHRLGSELDQLKQRALAVSDSLI